jgi:hypothetical protein
MGLHWYDRKGAAITLDEWAAHMENPDYGFVAATIVGDYLVSTVWMGIEPAILAIFNANPDRHHLIFETMVVDRKMIPVDFNDGEITAQWPTEKCAKLGHDRTAAKFCAFVRPGGVVRYAKDFADAQRLAIEWWRNG